MRRIFKYQLSPFEGNIQTLSIPYLSDDAHEKKREANCWSIATQIVNVAAQDNIPTVWIMVDDEMPKRDVTFILVETGASCTGLEPYEHIGTALQFNGEYVTHLFVKEG